MAKDHLTPKRERFAALVRDWTLLFKGLLLWGVLLLSAFFIAYMILMSVLWQSI